MQLTRTGSTSAALTVKLARSGSAKKKDLAKQQKYATFAIGAATVDLVVRAVNDHVAEKAETATIKIASGSAYASLSGSASASVRVLDAAAANADIKWTQAASGPVERVQPETAVDGGKVYVFSGYSNDHWQPIRRADTYDPATNKWTQLRDMPVGITHAADAVVGAQIWFAGGYEERVGTTGEQDIAVTSVRIYDTTTETWSTGPALPAQRGSGGMSQVDNKLYFYGGEQRNRANVTSTWALDLNDRAAGWMSRAPVPQGKTHFGTAVVNGEIYVFGGWQNVDVDATVLKESYAYNATTNAWRRLRDLPTPMSHLSPATVTTGGRIYMLGGEYKWNTESTQVLEYDPATDTYLRLSDLPLARASAVAAIVGDKFVFSGGKNGGWHNETYIGTWI